MTKPHSLTINWDSENPVPQILPQPSLLSSSKAGWNNIQLDYFYQPALETPEHSHTHHVLTVLTKSAPLKVERKLGEKFYSSYLPCNHFFLIPAGVTHQVWIHGDAEYLNLILEPDLIHTSAAELVNTESIELIPQH